jgi:hypothetical protein
MIEVITDMGRIIMVFMKASALTGNARIVIGVSGLA